LSEELTPETCPAGDGVAQVLIADQARRPEDTEWQYSDIISDYVRILAADHCRHVLTICNTCIDSWRIDYIVILAPPGTPLPDIPDD
jgi:hypothetical protein